MASSYLIKLGILKKKLSLAGSQDFSSKVKPVNHTKNKDTALYSCYFSEKKILNLNLTNEKLLKVLFLVKFVIRKVTNED